jgi:hypothetical protein
MVIEEIKPILDKKKQDNGMDVPKNISPVKADGTRISQVIVIY